MIGLLNIRTFILMGWTFVFVLLLVAGLSWLILWALGGRR